MTWKGLHPQVTLNNKVYEKGLTLTDLEMELVNNRLERNPPYEISIYKIVD
jgi:hypothetical protein